MNKVIVKTLVPKDQKEITSFDVSTISKEAFEEEVDQYEFIGMEYEKYLLDDNRKILILEYRRLNAN